MRTKIFTTGGVLALLILGLMFLNYSDVNAGKIDKVYGWAWSENIGWLSLNCYNPEIGSGCLPDYSVDFDLSTQKVFGQAWSEYGGWFCFGRTCDDWGEGLTPDNGSSDITILNSGLLTGWAKWRVLGPNGWTSLQGPQQPVSPVVKPFNFCKNCDSLNGNCSVCFESEANGGSGNICEFCSNCVADADHYNCTECSNCYDYGTAIDFESNTLLGWAWNNDHLTQGFGWLQFQPGQSPPGLVNPPYVSTKYGDIYAEQGLGSFTSTSPPSGKFSGSFMLQVGPTANVFHFTSCMAKTGGLDPECLGKGEGSAQGWVKQTPALGFPTQSNSYRNEFGPIDLRGLLAGQYGARQDIMGQVQINNPLGGKVYFYDGDLMINSPMQFLNAVGSNSGAGTIVVRGDLYLNQNLTYQSGNVSDLNNLASVGFIVINDETGTKGNIYIDNNVTEIVGNYYSEAVFNTGGGDLPLKVNGLAVARTFELNRQYADLDTRAPSEEIIYDGRVLANIPPGFGIMSQYLPNWFH